MITDKLYLMDKFNITFDRYRILFANENMFGIFRAGPFAGEFEGSSGYELICLHVYNGNSVWDVMNDIIYMSRAGKVPLKTNDVICIRLNGCFVSYMFCGTNKGRERKDYSYIEVAGFCDLEKAHYINSFHDENMVINIPDGRLYQMGELDPSRRRIYCIDKETFVPQDRAGNIFTDYSLFTLKGNNIVNANPHAKPFVMMSNALYYFYRSWHKDNSAVLLLDKNELELLRDYIDLHNDKLVI